MYFGDWQGYYSGDWFGDSAEEGQAAFPSLFAFWAGGNVGVEPAEVVSVGFKSLLAFWLGGNAGAASQPDEETGSGGTFGELRGPGNTIRTTKKHKKSISETVDLLIEQAEINASSIERPSATATQLAALVPVEAVVVETKIVDRVITTGLTRKIKNQSDEEAALAMFAMLMMTDD